MKPGISSYAFGWAVNAGGFTPDTLLDFAIAQGVPVIQIGDHLPLHTMEQATLDALAARARAAGIEIEAGARGLTAEHLARYIAIARPLNARLLRFVVDAKDHEPSAEEVVSIIRDAVPALREAGVTLGIENHDRFPCATLREIVDSVASEHVGVCLDTANSLGAGEGIREVLAALAPVCVNLHMKDFAIARLPHLMGFTVTGRALGEGMLPLLGALDAVRAHGRCTTAILETWPPPEREIGATLAKENDWAVRGIQVLRAVLEQRHSAEAAPIPLEADPIYRSQPLGKSRDGLRAADHDRFLYGK